MSIRNIAYQLCKSVWESKHRDEIKNLLWNLNTMTEDQMRSGNHRSDFGYAARQIKAQLLGYLHVNRNKTEIEKNFPPLRRTNSLLPEEQYLLEGAHKQLVELDALCVAPLLEKLQQFAPAIDPYHQFNYRISEQATNVELFPISSRNELVNAYHQHPALTIALTNHEEAMKVMTIEQINKAAMGLERKLLNASPLHFPNDLAYLTNTLAENTSERKCFNFFSGLMCLSGSLVI